MNENSSRGMTRAPSTASDGRPLPEAVARAIAKQRFGSEGAWTLLLDQARAAIDVTHEALAKEFDANVDRLKACEHIADGDGDWEALRNECPSTAAVARLRDQAEVMRAGLEGIAEERDTGRHDGRPETYPVRSQYEMLGIALGTLEEVDELAAGRAPVGSAPPSDAGGSNAPSSPPLSAGEKT